MAEVTEVADTMEVVGDEEEELVWNGEERHWERFLVDTDSRWEWAICSCPGRVGQGTVHETSLGLAAGSPLAVNCGSGLGSGLRKQSANRAELPRRLRGERGQTDLLMEGEVGRGDGGGGGRGEETGRK